MKFPFLSHRQPTPVPVSAGAIPAAQPLSTPKPIDDAKEKAGLFTRRRGKHDRAVAEKPKRVKKDAGDLGKAFASLQHFGLGRERNRFVENLATLLNAGLTITECLKTIELEVRAKPMKKIIQNIQTEVESGSALWRAMDKQNFFSPYTLALIRIGEEAGSLARNMEYLAEQQEKDRALRAKVKMAMIYPSIVLTLTFVITIGLAWFVLPKLVTVLTSLNTELPFITRMIIAIADFFTKHGIVAVPLFLLACVFLVLICRYTGLRGPTQQFVFRIPGIGTLGRTATIARFGVILGSLLKAGVPLIEAIRSMANVTDIVAYRAFYEKLAREIESGQSFAKAFEAIPTTTKLLPISVQQLVVTGEKSGALADMLMKIAQIYERKAEETAQRLPVILEPMLLFFIGGVVATVAFAIIVPIYSIVGSVGR